MIVHEDILQGSEEWEQIRLGRATASQASQIITSTGKLSASRTKYAQKIARECFAADPMEFVGNKFTDWGNDHEPMARGHFSMATGIGVHEVGFCTREDGVIGCSPDGLIKNPAGDWIAGLEIKCPTIDKHVDYYLNQDLPSEYKIQVHWSMATTGLPSWWFMSFFPGSRPLILQVFADEFTEKVKAAQDQFLIDYQEILPSVREVFNVESGEEEAA